ncbi:hypothetical protein RMR21_018705 [Agrobacterium sp. rho-8.1]|nr:hypothetical protein [Agrobacterium sp. rho-8.1]
MSSIRNTAGGYDQGICLAFNPTAANERIEQGDVDDIAARDLRQDYGIVNRYGDERHRI